MQVDVPVFAKVFTPVDFYAGMQVFAVHFCIYIHCVSVHQYFSFLDSHCWAQRFLCS